MFMDPDDDVLTVDYGSVARRVEDLLVKTTRASLWRFGPSEAPDTLGKGSKPGKPPFSVTPRPFRDPLPDCPRRIDLGRQEIIHGRYPG